MAKIENFNKNNQPFNLKVDNFDLVDGYLTAESWYRPKSILKNGAVWIPSKPIDRRPILMLNTFDGRYFTEYSKFMVDNKIINQEDVTDNVNETYGVIQVALEHQVSRKGLNWLRSTFKNFVNSRDEWNISSELPSNDHIQAGAFLYGNNETTKNANSDYRLLNRTPKNQRGDKTGDKGGFELLLANDVDNSNPVVQAEQVNWIHYLLNFGAITGNDPDANFDGIRVDAVDNVDADLLQIAMDYLRELKGHGKSDYYTNQSISIMEDWGDYDAGYIDRRGNPILTMDIKFQQQGRASLAKPAGTRSPMNNYLTWAQPERAESKVGDKHQPNYTFFRAHDSEVQDILAKIIKKLYPDIKNQYTPTPEQIEAGFKIYNEDMRKADKEYLHHNIPTIYALLLTNKDTIPRPYYGDLFTDDGQYMAKKSPYFDAIDALLRARKQFVGGAQITRVTKDDVMMQSRMGDGIRQAGDDCPDLREGGMGVVAHNNPNIKATEDVFLYMGKAHQKQKFRALINTDTNGLQVYLDPKNAPVRTTDEYGILTIGKEDIKGYKHPEVSGYLSVWVPADVEWSNKKIEKYGSRLLNSNGQYFQSNSSLDKHVIFESFSNFIDAPTKKSEFMNVKLQQPEVLEMLEAWGITSLQLPPQYRSSTDSSFLDSITANGYAFTDRYDLGFDKPTKYGTDKDLRNVIKAYHKIGIQVMADFVPDQIYNLPKLEAVTVTRTNAMGNETPDGAKNALYASFTKGGGAYQEKFGGAFLDYLKANFPETFSRVQVSTGKTINGDKPIKEWSAKYFNGTNIQGNGLGFILHDNNGNPYQITEDGVINSPF